MGSREVFVDAASRHLRDIESDEATPQRGRRQ
jgi:hypothetical protein